MEATILISGTKPLAVLSAGKNQVLIGSTVGLLSLTLGPGVPGFYIHLEWYGKPGSSDVAATTALEPAGRP